MELLNEPGNRGRQGTFAFTPSRFEHLSSSQSAQDYGDMALRSWIKCRCPFLHHVSSPARGMFAVFAILTRTSHSGRAFLRVVPNQLLATNLAEATA